MSTESRKFQTLELNQKYQVKKYDGPFKTDYGDYYILLVSEEQSDETFELYATKLLTQYITETMTTKKFSFIVKEKKGNKYPVIEGYSKERKWTVLK